MENPKNEEEIKKEIKELLMEDDAATIQAFKEKNSKSVNKDSGSLRDTQK